VLGPCVSSFLKIALCSVVAVCNSGPWKKGIIKHSFVVLALVLHSQLPIVIDVLSCGRVFFMTCTAENNIKSSNAVVLYWLMAYI